eukprot:TRINITY_DN2543_c0_g1_i1.p1 TRINITY_DN2543_c0_g1~~TRINITY_DN2543_c0_g1_i1.p1  ORF type:complete len:2150 (-),score=617.23 TRINITY_DN2543_c0_g1_i1:724-7173(-)
MDPRPKRSLRAPKKLSTRGRYVDDDEEEDSPVEDSSSSDSGNDSEAGDDSDDDPSWDGRRGEEDDFNVKPKKSRGGFRGRGRGRPGRPPANGHSSVHHDTYTPAQPQAYVQPAFVQQVAHQQRMMQQYGQPPSQSPSAAYLQQPGYAFPSQPPSYRSAQGSLIQPLGRAPVPPPQLVRPLGQPASPGQPTPQQQPTHIPGGYVVSSPYGPVPAQLLAKTGVSGSPAPGVRLTPGGYTTPQVSGAALPVNGQPGLAPPPSDDATNRKRNADGSPVVNGSTAGSNPPQPSSNVVASTNPFAVPVPASPNPFLSIGAPGPTQDAARADQHGATPNPAFQMTRPAFNGIGLPAQVAGAHVQVSPQVSQQPRPSPTNPPSLVLPSRPDGQATTGMQLPGAVGGLQLDPFRQNSRMSYSSGGMGNSTIANALFSGPSSPSLNVSQALQQSQAAAMRQSLGTIVTSGSGPSPFAFQQQHPSLMHPASSPAQYQQQAGQPSISPQMQQYLLQKQQQLLSPQQQQLQHQHFQQLQQQAMLASPHQPPSSYLRNRMPTPTLATPPQPIRSPQQYYQQPLPADPAQRKMVTLMQRCELFSNQLKSVLSKWQEYSNREKEQAKAEAAVSGDAPQPPQPAPAAQPRTGTPTPPSQPRTQLTPMSFMAAIQNGQFTGVAPPTLQPPSVPAPAPVPVPVAQAVVPGLPSLPPPAAAASAPADAPPDVPSVDVQALVDSLLEPSAPAVDLVATTEPVVDLTLAPAGAPAAAAAAPLHPPLAELAPPVAVGADASVAAPSAEAPSAVASSDTAAAPSAEIPAPAAEAATSAAADGASATAPAASTAASAAAVVSADAAGLIAAQSTRPRSPPGVAVPSAAAVPSLPPSTPSVAALPATGAAAGAGALVSAPLAVGALGAGVPSPSLPTTFVPAPVISLGPAFGTTPSPSLAPLSSQGALSAVPSLGPSATVPVPPPQAGPGDIGMIKQPDALTAELRSYQLIGLNWLFLLYKQDINGILADEMGLGKTIQTISLLGLLKERKLVTKPHLVIVPATAMQNWQRELSTWCPSLNVVMYSGSAREREMLRSELLGSRESRKDDREGARNLPDVLLSTYNLACNKVDRMKLFKKIDYSYIVLDEAHQIKNVASSRYQNLLKLAYKSERRLLLTGTPLQNNINELWALLSFLMPQIFGDAKEFMDLQWDETTTHDEQISRLRRIIAPFVLRRLKSEVLMKLPPKSESIIWCEMAPYRQRDLYFDTVNNSRSKFRMMQELKQRDREEYERQRQAENRLDGKNRADASETLRLEADRITRGQDKYEGEELKAWRRQLAQDKEVRLEQEREGDLQHILMQLRKASNNPLLFRKFYTDEICDQIEALLNQRAKKELNGDDAAAESAAPDAKVKAEAAADAAAADLDIKAEVKPEVKSEDGPPVPDLDAMDIPEETPAGRATRGPGSPSSRQSTPKSKARETDPEPASAKRRGASSPTLSKPKSTTKRRADDAGGEVAPGDEDQEAPSAAVVADGTDRPSENVAMSPAGENGPTDPQQPLAPPASADANAVKAESAAPVDPTPDAAADVQRPSADFEHCPMCGVEGDLLLCDECSFGYHIECLGLLDTPEQEKWFCPDCETREGPVQPALRQAVVQIIAALDESADTKGRKRSELFHFLPDRSAYEDYFKLIKNPICFSMIKKRPYQTPEAIRRDFHTLFHNAQAYNQPGSQVYRDSLTLKKVFLDEFEAAFAEVSADEYISPSEIANSVDDSDDDSRRGRGRKSGGGGNSKSKAKPKAAAGKARASSGGRKSAASSGGGSRTRPSNGGSGRDRPNRGSSTRPTPAAPVPTTRTASRSSRGSAATTPTPPPTKCASVASPAEATRVESGDDDNDSEASLRRSSRSRKRKSYKEESYDSMDDDQFLDSLRTNKRIKPTVQLSETLENCRSVIEELLEHEVAAPFTDPVDTDEPGLETYLELVKRPMHLRKIYDNVSTGIYKDVTEFIADVKLVFDNCLLFNEPGSSIVLNAQHLWTFFKREMRKIGVVVDGAQGKLTQKMKLRKDLVDLGERLRQKSDIGIHRFCKDYGLTDFYLPDAEVFDSSGKLIELRRLLESLRARGSRVLIFTQFTQMLNILEEFLFRMNWRYQRLDGKTPVLERQQLIDEFTNDPVRCVWF